MSLKLHLKQEKQLRFCIKLCFDYIIFLKQKYLIKACNLSLNSRNILQINLASILNYLLLFILLQMDQLNEQIL